ncbi:TonB-dependent receptor [Rubrivirga sp. S365]|uniref:TonB-dependent receptor n=1 Tax=Rubrivirga sp. S365 TaxID=3076080 RepID=UPI0028C9FE4C|nr:TonB-dependent receptor [Rubrivirga sp. S365]MDT7855026.1 TonB-dependent receptor [Rubrivirga sp. S365]
MHHPARVLALVAALAVGGGVCAAQTAPPTAWPEPGGAELVWTDAPLADALYELAEATGLELVFALRLVREARVSGRYRVTDDPDRALRLLLRDTGVRAERVRHRQYVLIREPLGVREGDGREAYTGTLDGRVVDAETGAPLWGAHVWLVDLGLGSVAGETGAFAVPDLPTGTYAVRVSHVGYQAVRLELDVFPASPRLPPTLRLQAETVETPDAAVVAGPEAPGSAPGVTDLGARQAAAVPYALGEGDLSATLSWLPGLSRTGGASGAVVVRGADPSRTRYVRDGVPLYEPWHAFGLFSAFQPEALARVRFHRGSLPAPLGGGLAGVLDVETTDALDGDTARVVEVGAVAARAVADVPLGGAVGVHVALRRSTLGALLEPGLRLDGGALVLDPTGGRAPDGPEPTVSFDDAAVKVSARLGAQARLDVAGTLGRDDVAVDLDGPAPVRPGPDRPALGRMAYGWRTSTLSARVRALYGSRTYLTATAYRSGHGAREERDLVGGAEDVEQTLVDVGVSVGVEHVRSLRHEVEGGVQVAARRVDGADAGGVAAQRATEVAVYAVDTWRPWPSWQLQPGLRAELVADGADGADVRASLSPRLFARWSPDARLVVRGGVSRQTQAVHRLRGSAGRYDLAASRWVLAGARAPVAVAWQGGVGAEWAPSAALAFSADLYARRSSGLLEPTAPAAADPGVDLDGLLRQYAPHAGRAAGVELAARYLRGPWTLGLSGALARADVRPEVGEPTGGAWRPSRYGRPLTLGLLAERRAGPFTTAVRLDLESGLVRPDGTREGAEVRASAAVGAGLTLLGLRWTALAQVTARPVGADPAPPAVAADGLPLATDARGLPALPLVTLTARW